MFVKTDFSLFQSALSIEKAVSACDNIAVLSDSNMFAVLPFVYECRNQKKTPIIAVEKQLLGAKYLFIALNKLGYQELLIAESFDSFKEIINSDNILPILLEIIDINQEIVFTEYSMLSSNEVSNRLLQSYSKEVIEARIINGIEDKDLYVAGMISAVGNTTNFSKSVLEIDFNTDFGDISKFETILKGVVDYFEFGDPTPPQFKFREKFAKVENIYHKEITDQELFVHLCKKGLASRFEGKDIPQNYIDRLNFEMSVIEKMRFPGYMLIVWDFVKEAKRLGIPVGPGRGSAAGSLVAYSLEITNIDPMKYDLLFERFLNPDRVSFPDIDMDFCRDRRGEVIDYVVKAYGKDYVAQVITFGKIGGKSSIRDSARALQAPLALADKIAKSIPSDPGMNLKKAYKANSKFWENWFKEDYEVDKIWKGAEALSGMTRNLGIHAAGLIIGTEKIVDKAPLYNINGVNAVGYDGQYLEDVDLVKFDFLGLKTLTVIDNAIKLIKANKNLIIDIDNIDQQDPKVYKKLSKGDTIGMFQIESPGMQDLNKRLQPDTFEDLIAILALYRPGPMESGMLDSFVDRKRGREKIDFFFQEMEEALKPILSPTYGVIVYQEQVMQIVQTIGGFSLGYSDIIRRAMGKKKDMSVYNEEFSTGAEKIGFNKTNASKLFDLIEKFAGYGFNKSHSAAYAMVTYQTAWLKTYYPLEFMTALINSEIENTEKMAGYIKEAKRMGIVVRNPDIRESKAMFTILDNQMVFGLKGIKGVGNGSESLQLAVKTNSSNLIELLSVTQLDISAELIKKIKLKNRIEAQIDSANSKISKSETQINKFSIRRAAVGSLTEFQMNSERKHFGIIEDLRRLIFEKRSEIESINIELVELDKLKNNSSLEKLNKRVFESLASVGALSCFGFSRKFLIENIVELLSLKFDSIEFNKVNIEYDMQEILLREESHVGLIFKSPFSPEIMSLEDNEEMPILAVIGKESRRKKNGDIYLNLKLMNRSGEVVEVSDFNNKSEKFDIGSVVSATIRINGNYKNLQYIKYLNKSNYTSKSITLKLNIFDDIPEDLTSVNIIEVYDFSKLVLTMNVA